MKRLNCYFALLLFAFIGSGCATSSESYKMPYSDDNSEADGAAFSADMSVRKPMPNRPNKPKSWAFYFKHCSMNGDESHYSKTSYDCTGP